MADTPTLVNQLKPLLDAAAALRDLGALETALAERQTQLERTTAILTDLKQQVDIAAVSLTDLQTAHAEEIATHTEQLQIIKKEVSKVDADRASRLEVSVPLETAQ